MAVITQTQKPGGSGGDVIEKLVKTTSTNFIRSGNSDKLMPNQLEVARGAIKAIMDVCNSSGVTDKGQQAYILATARHESVMGNRMKEGIAKEKAEVNYMDPKKGLGNATKEEAWLYIGRGFSQITGKANYDKWSKRLNIDLVKDPDKAMDPHIAAQILVISMRDGLFVPKAGRLETYIKGETRDFFNARKTVNPLEIINKPDIVKVMVHYAETYYQTLIS